MIFKVLGKTLMFRTLSPDLKTFPDRALGFAGIPPLEFKRSLREQVAGESDDHVSRGF